MILLSTRTLQSVLIATLTAGLLMLLSYPAFVYATEVTITLRADAVEAINSITLIDSEVSKIADGPLATAVYTIDFSIYASGADLLIPASSSRGETSVASDIEYAIESREGVVTSGYTAGIVIGDSAIQNGMYRVPTGETRQFTLVVVYADYAVPDREDRLQVMGMTLRAGLKTLELNPSEVQELKTKRLELYK